MKNSPAEVAFKLRQVFKEFPEGAFSYLFGSVAEGTAGPLSDIDIAVLLDPFRLESILPLHNALCRALKRDEIDLLILNQTKNIILLEEIVRHGILIYEKDPIARLDFEWKIIHQAIDFRETRKRIFGA